MVFRFAVCVAALSSLFLAFTPAFGSETRDYTYDSLGRLVSRVSSGSVNDDDAVTFCYDAVGNRIAFVASEAGSAASCAEPPAGCSFAPSNVSGSDEFSLYPGVSVVGSCPATIVFGYTVETVSGSGGYYDMGFLDGSSLPAGGQTKQIGIAGPGECGVPEGTSLVLRVNWTVVSGSAAVSPTFSTVTFNSSC